MNKKNKKISLQTYNNLKNKYGLHSSWAVWADETSGKKVTWGIF